MIYYYYYYDNEQYKEREFLKLGFCEELEECEYLAHSFQDFLEKIKSSGRFDLKPVFNDDMSYNNNENLYYSDEEKNEIKELYSKYKVLQ